MHAAQLVHQSSQDGCGQPLSVGVTFSFSTLLPLLLDTRGSSGNRAYAETTNSC